MSFEQLLILLVLLVTVILFLWGRWRHDMVAMAALLACVLAGLTPAAEAFSGFGHPAVVTVACVLVLSRALQTSGAIDALVQRVVPGASGPTVTIAALTGLAALLSAVMNNVGALALLMPVAILVAQRQGLQPGRVLMPVAFGSILGGMTTLIGTPPNLIVSGFRAEYSGNSFGMFDFTPVGAAVAVIGVAFVAVLGWRLVPARERAGVEGFETGKYLTEARVPADSKIVGKTLRDIDKVLEDADAQVTGLIRGQLRLSIPSSSRVLRAGDILEIEAEPESLAQLLSTLGLKLEEDVRELDNGGEDEAGTRDDSDDADADTDVDVDADTVRTRAIDSAETTLLELAVLPSSTLIGRSATDIRLRTRYGINLLAFSRQGRRSLRRLRSIAVQPGDVLLMQGSPESLSGFASEFSCVPLAERAIRIPDRRNALLSALIMGGAVFGAAFGLLPAAISFAGGVLALMVLRVMPPRLIYDAIDWPVIVLLGALIPVAGAMATTGAADLIARLLLDGLAQGSPVIALVIVLVVTMTLSDFMNNAATAAVMCPIALSAAAQLGVSGDSFLMAVAIGASCAFLTPIGHQNNTLILGPGGFKFGDYWRLGLPLEILVVLVSVPLLLRVWPL
jgi:di/tricarboxylate transporter